MTSPVPVLTAYVVTNDARGIPRHVTTDRAAAITWAQSAANADLDKNPHAATPHYVVTPWYGQEMTDGAVHVYGQPEPEDSFWQSVGGGTGCAVCDRSLRRAEAFANIGVTAMSAGMIDVALDMRKAVAGRVANGHADCPVLT